MKTLLLVVFIFILLFGIVFFFGHYNEENVFLNMYAYSKQNDKHEIEWGEEFNGFRCRIIPEQIIYYMQADKSERVSFCVEIHDLSKKTSLMDFVMPPNDESCVGVLFQLLVFVTKEDWLKSTGYDKYSVEERYELGFSEPKSEWTGTFREPYISDQVSNIRIEDNQVVYTTISIEGHAISRHFPYKPRKYQLQLIYGGAGYKIGPLYSNIVEVELKKQN